MQKPTLFNRLLAPLVVAAVLLSGALALPMLRPLSAAAQAETPARCTFAGQSGVYDCPASINPQPGKCYQVVQAESPGQKDTAREVNCTVAPFTETKAYEVEAQCTDNNLTADNCKILHYIRWLINLLSALVGIVVILMIVVGGIQYTTAGANPQRVAAARQRIINALLALFMFIFMYSFLQWVVPGGIF